MNYQLFIP
jgi:hypothetical protein